MKNLTTRQREIYEFLVDISASTGHFPSLQEISDHFGFASTTSARDHLQALEKKGAIRRDPGKARSLQIVEPFGSTIDARFDGIPILGRIAAGKPVEAIEHCDRFLPMPTTLFGGKEIFALEVRGDSMIDAGIFDGDIAMIERRETVESGQIAAVIIDEEATLKTVVRNEQKIILRASNPAFPDITIQPRDGNTVRIAGKYVGLVRSAKKWEAMVA